jgi:hypothetical protein
MYTSFALVALGFLAGTMPESPSWRADYSIALKEGQQSRKPLAVFIGTGKSGWDRLTKGGKLDSEINRVLSSKYVCVYVDTTQSAGRRLASDFELTDGVGIVLSDYTGTVQAFRHQGVLADRELLQKLNRYADPERVIRSTEGAEVTRVSNYAPEDAPAPYNVQPRSYYRSSGRC